MTPVRPRLALLAALSLALVVLAACGSGNPGGAHAGGQVISKQDCAKNRAAGTMTYASPFGYDASAGILDVFVAQKLGYFQDLCLGVRLVTNSPQSTELVSSGRATVSGIGSAADDLEAVANGANVVGTATFGDVSNYAILTRPAVSRLSQLQGRTFGYHFTVPVSILEMFRAAGVQPSRIDMVDTTDYDPNQLIQGHVDGLQAYQSNEPLILHAEHQRFNEFTPAQLGVQGTFNVQIFNRAFLDGHRTAAGDFLRAELHAFDYCTAHAAQCLHIEAGYARASGATYDLAHEAQVWALESRLARDHTLPGRGVGVQSQAEWQPEAQALGEYQIVKGLPGLHTWEDTSLVASLYHGKTLIWP